MLEGNIGLVRPISVKWTKRRQCSHQQPCTGCIIRINLLSLNTSQDLVQHKSRSFDQEVAQYMMCILPACVHRIGRGSMLPCCWCLSFIRGRTGHARRHLCLPRCTGVADTPAAAHRTGIQSVVLCCWYLPLTMGCNGHEGPSFMSCNMH